MILEIPKYTSPECGRWAAGAYTLVESAKLNGIESYRYLKDVLLRVWTQPIGKIDDLMPRRWKSLKDP